MPPWERGLVEFSVIADGGDGYRPKLRTAAYRQLPQVRELYGDPEVLNALVAESFGVLATPQRLWMVRTQPNGHDRHGRDVTRRTILSVPRRFRSVDEVLPLLSEARLIEQLREGCGPEQASPANIDLDYLPEVTRRLLPPRFYSVAPSIEAAHRTLLQASQAMPSGASFLGVLVSQPTADSRLSTWARSRRPLDLAEISSSSSQGCTLERDPVTYLPENRPVGEGPAEWPTRGEIDELVRGYLEEAKPQKAGLLIRPSRRKAFKSSLERAVAITDGNRALAQRIADSQLSGEFGDLFRVLLDFHLSELGYRSENEVVRQLTERGLVGTGEDFRRLRCLLTLASKTRLETEYEAFLTRFFTLFSELVCLRVLRGRDSMLFEDSEQVMGNS